MFNTSGIYVKDLMWYIILKFFKERVAAKWMAGFKLQIIPICKK